MKSLAPDYWGKWIWWNTLLGFAFVSWIKPFAFNILLVNSQANMLAIHYLKSTVTSVLQFGDTFLSFVCLFVGAPPPLIGLFCRQVVTVQRSHRSVLRIRNEQLPNSATVHLSKTKMRLEAFSTCLNQHLYNLHKLPSSNKARGCANE